MPCPPPVTTTLAAASSGACRPGPAQAHGGSSPAYGEKRVAASRTPRRPASAASSSPVAPTEPLVVISESTASVGATGLLEAALAGLRGVRLAATRFSPYAGELPPWACAGPGRQAPLLAAASVVVTGGGHGMVAKALLHGLPAVLVPGGGGH